MPGVRISPFNASALRRALAGAHRIVGAHREPVDAGDRSKPGTSTSAMTARANTRAERLRQRHGLGAERAQLEMPRETAPSPSSRSTTSRNCSWRARLRRAVGMSFMAAPCRRLSTPHIGRRSPVHPADGLRVLPGRSRSHRRRPQPSAPSLQKRAWVRRRRSPLYDNALYLICLGCYGAARRTPHAHRPTAARH